MRLKPLIVLVFMAFACNKQNECDHQDKLPECIFKLIVRSPLNVPIKTIKMQTVDGECHYWLNTDAMHYDGVEAIVNSNCDTVCFYCSECLPPPCSDEYPIDKWVTIWTK